MPTRVLREIRSGEEIIQLVIRLGLLAFLLYWSFVLVRPFIPIFAWSVVLAVALYPAFNWLSVHLGGRPKLAAAIITSLNLAIVIGPATWLGLGLIESLQSFAGQLDCRQLDRSVSSRQCQGLADCRHAASRFMGSRLD